MLIFRRVQCHCESATAQRDLSLGALQSLNLYSPLLIECAASNALQGGYGRVADGERWRLGTERDSGSAGKLSS